MDESPETEAIESENMRKRLKQAEIQICTPNLDGR